MGRPAIDLTGQRFGRLVVLQRVGNTNDGHAKWLCQCDCGNTTEVASNVLKKGNTKSCGCLNKEVASEKAKQAYVDLRGRRFGRLVALEPVGSKKEKMWWKCQCDCGNFLTTTSHHLTSGNTQSCGCLKSKGEQIIASILQNANIDFESQKIFTDLPNSRYDFYLQDYNRLIEYDGIHHYKAAGGWSTEENFRKMQERDQKKNEYALAHNIPLVRIPYWERDTITLDMILGDKYLVTAATGKA